MKKLEPIFVHEKKANFPKNPVKLRNLFYKVTLPCTNLEDMNTVDFRNGNELYFEYKKQNPTDDSSKSRACMLNVKFIDPNPVCDIRNAVGSSETAFLLMLKVVRSCCYMIFLPQERSLAWINKITYSLMN
jgi:hypothetical protein